LKLFSEILKDYFDMKKEFFAECVIKSGKLYALRIIARVFKKAKRFFTFSAHYFNFYFAPAR